MIGRRYWMLACCEALLLCLLAAPAAGGDWPTWRADAHRSASTPDELPARLHLQWVLRLGPLKPAWPDEPRMQFDAAYQPIVAGNTMFVASSRDDSVAAFDVRTAGEKWRFHADGPVRFAPTAWRGKLYFVSDDGCLYCLDADTGALRWKFRGGPSDRRLLGNERLISLWPARGAPVVAEGNVYFAAGIWPFMGVFVYALDAETGREVWCNDATGSMYIRQPHSSSAFAGLAPQGYLVAAGEVLLVPNGRAVAAGLDRRTGKLLYFHHSANKYNGHSEAAALGEHFLNGARLFDLADGYDVTDVGLIGLDARKIRLRERNSAQAVFDRQSEELIKPLGSLGVVAGQTYYQSTGRAAVAVDLSEPKRRSVLIDDDEDDRPPADPRIAWKLPVAARPMVKAGGRLYAAGEREILAIGPAKPRRKSVLELFGDLAGGAEARAEPPRPDVAWRMPIGSAPAGMIAAAGRLIVTTLEGDIYCYGAEAAGKAPAVAQPAGPPSRPAGEDPAGEVLRATGVTEGYCLVLGMTDGRLAEGLARGSKLRVIVVDADAGKVEAFRRRLDRRELPASRLAAIVADPRTLPLPPYLAALIVSEDPAALRGEGQAERLFEVLRPYGGVMCLALSDDVRGPFERALGAGRLAGAEPRQVDGLTLLSRPGPLPGAGTWTGQYGNPANTCVSEDRLVRAPLGLLWFGGPSNANVLPRHGHGPPEQVLGGRLFIEGPDCLRALDVYTGRLLWEAELPDVGANYDNTTHEPGANAVGTNFLACADGVYVTYGPQCLRLDPATGRTVGRLVVPGLFEAGTPLTWGYVGVWEDLLVGTVLPMSYWTPDLAVDEFLKKRPRKLRRQSEFDLPDTKPKDEARYVLARPKRDIAALAKAIGSWKGFEPVHPTVGVDPPPETQPTGLPTTRPANEVDFIVANFNRMLRERSVYRRIPPAAIAAGTKYALAARKKDREVDTPDEVQAEITRHLSKWGTGGAGDAKLRALNRRLLEACYPKLPRKPQPQVGRWNPNGISSLELVVLDRHSGRVLWRRKAGSSFRHNTIVLAGGKIFCIDRTPTSVVRQMLRRGIQPQAAAALLALDIRTGREIWRTSEDVFGTWLSYSAEHDVLLEAGRASRDMLGDEPDDRLVAHRGATGGVLWDQAIEYEGPCMIHGRTIITQGFAMDLLTGQVKQRRHPLTGEPIDWEFVRNYGCNTVIGSQHLLTFRSAAAGFYDLAGDGGTGNLGGFKSGCTSNLVAADGVLNAPDYTRTCTCSYQNQSSLALIHMGEADLWTFQDFGRGRGPIRRVGINLGAPGDRWSADGTIWLDWPPVGGRSPRLNIDMSGPDGNEPAFFRHHPSRIVGDGLKWVAASGVEGLTSLSIELIDRKPKPAVDADDADGAAHMDDLDDPPVLSRSRRPAAPAGAPVEPKGPLRYTVSLHFVEPPRRPSRPRIFSVALQGKEVLRDFNVLAEAGGPGRAVVKTFRGIEVDKDLELTFRTSAGLSLLCGMEIIAED